MPANLWHEGDKPPISEREGRLPLLHPTLDGRVVDRHLVGVRGADRLRRHRERLILAHRPLVVHYQWGQVPRTFFLGNLLRVLSVVEGRGGIFGAGDGGLYQDRRVLIVHITIEEWRAIMLVKTTILRLFFWWNLVFLIFCCWLRFVKQIRSHVPL